MPSLLSRKHLLVWNKQLDKDVTLCQYAAAGLGEEQLNVLNMRK